MHFQILFEKTLSLSSLNCCTCGAISEPYVAVAIKQPPSSDCSLGFSAVDLELF